MARFAGKIGYGETVETRPGVYEDVITERPYIGDLEWSNRRYLREDQVNNNIVVNNSISVVADSFANEHFMNIRYVVWNGTKWTVSSTEVKHPRLILYIGEVYNESTS